jgi:hypothetical protein
MRLGNPRFLSQFTCVGLRGMRSYKHLHEPPPQVFAICSAAETKLDCRQFFPQLQYH